MFRRYDQTLIFESSLIGAVEFMSDGNFDVKLIDVDDSDMRLVLMNVKSYFTILSRIIIRLKYGSSAIDGKGDHWDQFQVSLSIQFVGLLYRSQ